MTPGEIRIKFDALFADNTTGDISEADLREFNKDLTDFLGVAQITDIIPTWTALLTFQTDASDDGEFCIHADTSGNIRLWQTKIDDNINNEPPTDPNITSDTNWQEVSASSNSVFVEWAAGIYGAGLIIVYYNNGFYKLEVAQRPYTSVNIETEISAGDWVLISGLGNGQGTTFNVNKVDLGGGSELTGSKDIKVAASSGGHLLSIWGGLGTDDDKRVIIEQPLVGLYARAYDVPADRNYAGIAVENVGAGNISPGTDIAAGIWARGIDTGIGAMISMSPDGYVLLHRPSLSTIFKGLKYLIENAEIDWAGDELLVPHQKRVLEIALNKLTTPDQTIASNVEFLGQASANDDTVQSFSATPTFNFNNGNDQEMPVTGNVTAFATSNEVGSANYKVWLINDATAGRTVAAPTGWTKAASSDDHNTAANSINLYQFFTRPGGEKYYSILNI